MSVSHGLLSHWMPSTFGRTDRTVRGAQGEESVFALLAGVGGQADAVQNRIFSTSAASFGFRFQAMVRGAR